MDLVDVGATVASLGALVRSRRRELGMTQTVLAKRAGLSVGFISQLERGSASPSLSSMVSIAHALGRAPGDFLTQPLSLDPMTVAKSRGRFNVAKDGALLEYERISSTFPGSALNSILMHVPPGYKSEINNHEGEELLFVLKGSVIVTVGGREFALQKHDSVHYKANQPHSCASNSADHSLILWVGTFGLFSQ